MRDLELWAGPECTVNRLGDRYLDQLRRGGHHDRLDDLDLLASLGVNALRYPVLWERTAPARPDEQDFSWSDERLARLQALGVAPIVGLIHHGSGPAYTELLDPGFAPGLTAHARACAERYPHVDAWTPVNEPLTTARFSLLYGAWHPHRTDERAFWMGLLNQIDAVRLSMDQIRQVIPAARLIQTEDLGRTYSTRALAHQASHDNARRWMTIDLLIGAVVPGHELWDRLERLGLGDRLRAIADAPCPPDVIGINHYLTSDRFLDHRCERYPAHTHGKNQFMAFADVEAVRVLLPGPGGLEERLEETARRYGLPIAITESHNGCTREEQMRWTLEAWDIAHRLRARGVDIQAVTAWAAFGAHDWNGLLTREEGCYEPGAFDVRAPTPRPTALAGLLRHLATGEPPLHPAAHGPGWWRRDIRLQHPPVFRTVAAPEARGEWRSHTRLGRTVLITGATGTLGRAIARACEWRGLDYILTARADLDLAASAGDILDRLQPFAVINAAGYVRVDDAESDAKACLAANADGAGRLALLCAERDIAFLGFSSDLVFDGEKGCAYVESDPLAPLNVYGRSKAQAERAVLAAGGQGLMIRTAAFFSPYDPHNFAAQVVRNLSGGRVVEAAEDLVVSPTYVPDLVAAALDLMIDGETGVWHLANQGAVSWATFAAAIARALGLDEGLVVPRPAGDLDFIAPRPRAVPLASERGWIMPTLASAIDRYAQTLTSADFEAEVTAPIDRDDRTAGAPTLSAGLTGPLEQPGADGGRRAGRRPPRQA